jgi:hypothetical protein
VSRFVRIVLRVCALPGCVSLVWPGISHAQALDPLRVGARISVIVRDASCRGLWRRCDSGAGLGGTLVRVTPDSLVVQYGPSATVSVPRIPGQHIYVSAGASRVRSALRGAVMFGLASGLLVARTDASRRSMVQTTAGIAVSGLAAGAFLPTERWQRVAP